MSNETNPFLQGNFAPWRSEDKFDHLEVEGQIPADLNGVLLRNGPNPQFDPKGHYHWFEGDGMLHAIRIKNGNASYDNRWVRTQKFVAENEAGHALLNSDLTAEESTEISTNTANTNIVYYNRNLLALNEGASPVSIQLSNLHTIGDFTYQGQATRALTAHPRYDFKRKELLTYSYIDEDLKLMYYRFDQKNKKMDEKAINWPYCAMMHDFVNTENYVIFPVFPCTLSFERMYNGQNIFMWEGDELNTFFIITDKSGNEVSRIETDPCYVYHFANAYEDNDHIIVDAFVANVSPLMPDRHGKVASKKDCDTRLARWTFNLKDNTHHLNYIDDRTGEFPRFDERFNGLPYQYIYCCGRDDEAKSFDRIMCYDMINNQKTEHYFDGDTPSEPVFVPKSSKEGDGYLLTVVYRQQQDISEVIILDANAIDKAPLAVIKIPHRIPFGFHGNFVSI